MRKCENIVKMGVTILTVIYGSVNSTKLNNWPTFFSTLLFILTLLPLCVIVSTGHLMSIWTNLLFCKSIFDLFYLSSFLYPDLTFQWRSVYMYPTDCKSKIILLQTVQRGDFFFLLFLASTNKAGSCIEEMFDMFHSCLLQLCSCTVKLVESRGLFCFSVSHLCPFYWTYWCVFILYMKWTCRYSVVWSIAGDMTQVYTSKASLVFWCCMTDLPCLKTTILSIKFLFWNKSHAENDHVCNLHVASWVIGET